MSEHAERLLTLYEVAAELADELSVEAYFVRGAVAAVRGRVETVPGQRHGKSVQLYGPRAVQIIRKRVVRNKTLRELIKEPGAAYWRGLGRLRVTGRRLGKLLNDFKADYDLLRVHPPAVSATIHTLPSRELELAHPPVVVLVRPLRGKAWRAEWHEAGLEAHGKGEKGAVVALREEIVRAYLALRESPEQNPEQWTLLQQLIRDRPRPAQAAEPADERREGHDA